MPPARVAAHDEYHTDAEAWEKRYGTHAELLLAFWASVGFKPGDFMTVGMKANRASWFRRVLDRLAA